MFSTRGFGEDGGLSAASKIKSIDPHKIVEQAANGFF
jgi:hypothetical protein